MSRRRPTGRRSVVVELAYEPLDDLLVASEEVVLSLDGLANLGQFGGDVVAVPFA